MRPTVPPGCLQRRLCQPFGGVALDKIAFIGLGSNLGDSPGLLGSALKALATLPDSRLVACSPFYRSPAMTLGDAPQPDYCNAVAQLATRLAPEPLLTALLAIERAHGRLRAGEGRWQPRTLDLDLLALGAECVHTGRLQLPHPGLSQRDFVLQPWADLAPRWPLADQSAVGDMLTRLCGDGRTPLPVWGRVTPRGGIPI